MTNPALVAHVLCGAVALASAAASFMTKKGKAWHAKVGMVYTLAMMGVSLTAFILVFMGASLFLMMIGLFSGYMVAVGWRRAVNRRGAMESMDKALIYLGGAATVGLLLVSMLFFTGTVERDGESGSFGVVPLVFGLICAGLVWGQVQVDEQGRGPRGKARITQHVVFMGAGTISTVTAFLLTAVGDSVFMWLLPTVIGTALITGYARQVNDGKIFVQ